MDMFDRQNQPVWLKLINVLALLCLCIFIFTADVSRSGWAIAIMVGIFLIAAALNFLIQFRDLFTGTSANKSRDGDTTEPDARGLAPDAWQELGDGPSAEDEDAEANRAWLAEKQAKQAGKQLKDAD